MAKISNGGSPSTTANTTQTHVQLRNGVHMPILGLGTTHNGGYNHEAVVYGLRDCGVRLIDTARRYGTEPFVGQAIIDSGVDRSEVFLATKLWPGDYGLHSSRLALSDSLRRLQTDYLDLYLMHWPKCREGVDRKTCLQDTWRALELELESGRCRSIGVSNFGEGDLLDLLETASVVPHVNQCEFHPLQNPTSLRRFCADAGVQFQGYCPLGKGLLLGEAEVAAAAERERMTPAQVLIRWALQNGVVTIPKSTKKDRVWQNSQVLSDDFMLSFETMHILDELHLHKPNRKLVNRQRIESTMSEEAAGRKREDGYKLKEARNVFPTCVESGAVAQYARVSA